MLYTVIITHEITKTKISLTNISTDSYSHFSALLNV